MRPPRGGQRLTLTDSPRVLVFGLTGEEVAYVPDEAIERMNELSPGAWRLYCFLCRCRNQKTGACHPSASLTAESIDTHPKNVFRLRRELVATGWAAFTGDKAENLFGFSESSKNATTHTATKVDTVESSKNATQEAEGSKNATPELQKCYQEVAKMLPRSSKNATAYKEEPAKEPANEPSKQASDSPFDSFGDVPEVLSAQDEQKRYKQFAQASSKPMPEDISFSQFAEYVRAMHPEYTDESVLRVAGSIRKKPGCHEEVRAWLALKRDGLSARAAPILIPPGLTKQEQKEFLLAQAQGR